MQTKHLVYLEPSFSFYYNQYKKCSTHWTSVIEQSSKLNNIEHVNRNKYPALALILIMEEDRILTILERL